ncbi:hypothetical protein [Nostoc sp. FACHB-892]|nr:hypothetical protein [Nostoc sp. FACHB-892]
MESQQKFKHWLRRHYQLNGVQSKLGMIIPVIEFVLGESDA